MFAGSLVRVWRLMESDFNRDSFVLGKQTIIEGGLL